MNDDASQARSMNRRQLRAVVYKIAVTYLEVERGLRPPDQLAAFLSPTEYRRHRATTRRPRAVVRPVRPPDIGRVRIDAATSKRVNASVLVRRDDDAWSSLLVDLEKTGRGWQVDRLDRLERLLPPDPRQVEIIGDALAPRAGSLDGERRPVAAAHDPAAEAVEEPEVPAAERALLARPRRLPEDHGTSTLPEQPHDGHGRDAADTSILGPRPENPSRAQIWDSVKEELDAYRDRWDLPAAEPLLHSPASEEQAGELQQLLHRLADAVNDLAPTSCPARTDMVVDPPRSMLGVDL
jgi:hypothetical protein